MQGYYRIDRFFFKACNRFFKLVFKPAEWASHNPNTAFFDFCCDRFIKRIKARALSQCENIIKFYLEW
ncbi:MAG: hypothetical protein IJ299_06105 [Oscillospiraceae bacterium]|nr:hypothetical protein [Oscillospiraceae bacterium]